jgi:hypothetical protein
MPRNLLAYPAGVPAGVNPTHLAASHQRLFSAIPSGANFVNLTSGRPGTRVGTPTSVINAVSGPGVHFSSTNAANFSGQDTNQATVTIAAIFKVDSNAVGFNPILANTSDSAGIDFRYSGAFGSTIEAASTLLSAVILWPTTLFCCLLAAHTGHGGCFQCRRCQPVSGCAFYNFNTALAIGP